MLIATLALGAAATVSLSECWPLLLVILPLQSALMFVFRAVLSRCQPRSFAPGPPNERSLRPRPGHRDAGSAKRLPFSPMPATTLSWAAPVTLSSGRSIRPMFPDRFACWRRSLKSSSDSSTHRCCFLRSVFVGNLTHHEKQMVMRGYIAIICCWALVMAVVYRFPSLDQVPDPGRHPRWRSPGRCKRSINSNNTSASTATPCSASPARWSTTIRSARFFSAAMLYNDYHGTHHRYAKIPYYHLPQATPYALSGRPANTPRCFSNIVSASIDMLYCLVDPKVGPQWKRREERAVTSKLVRVLRSRPSPNQCSQARTSRRRVFSETRTPAALPTNT